MAQDRPQAAPQAMRVVVGQRVEFSIGYIGGELLPELRWAGFGVWTRRDPQKLGNHAHSGAWEICHLVRGQIYQVIEGQTHLWRAGEMIVFPPAVEHSGIQRVAHRAELAYLGIDFTAPLPGLDPDTNANLLGIYRGMTARAFPGDPDVLAAFSALFLEGRDRRSDPEAGIIARSHLHRIIFGTARAWRRAGPARETAFSPAVATAIALMRERLAAPPRATTLAQAVGLGRSALHARFVTETGLSPGEYHARLRIERAQELMRDAAGDEGTTNARIALTLGFASPQHFSTAFKRATGKTPGAWRKGIQ